MNFTNEELQRALHLRAIEWVNWPSFLSQLFAPVLFCLYSFWLVIGALFIIAIGWSMVRYRFHNFRLASVAAIAIGFAKWPIAITCCFYLVRQHRYGVAVAALLWPWLCALVLIPGKIGKCELNFAIETGYVGSEHASHFD